MVIFPDIPHRADVPCDAPCSILQTHFHSSSFSELVDRLFPMSELVFPSRLLSESASFPQQDSPQLVACLEAAQLPLRGAEKHTEDASALPHPAQHSPLPGFERPHQQRSHLRKPLSGQRHHLYQRKHYMEKLTVNEVAPDGGRLPRSPPSSFTSTSIWACPPTLPMSHQQVHRLRYLNSQYPLTDLALDMGFGEPAAFFQGL